MIVQILNKLLGQSNWEKRKRKGEKEGSQYNYYLGYLL